MLRSAQPMTIRLSVCALLLLAGGESLVLAQEEPKDIEQAEGLIFWRQGFGKNRTDAHIAALFARRERGGERSEAKPRRLFPDPREAKEIRPANNKAKGKPSPKSDKPRSLDCYCLSVSWDGKKVAYGILDDKVDFPPTIAIRNVGGQSKEQSLMIRAHKVFWSPDGKQLLAMVFRRDKKGFRHILVDLDGTEPKYRLLYLPSNHMATDWSKDGRIITTAFPTEKGKTTQIHSVRLQNKRLKISAIPGTEGGLHGKASPRGSGLLFLKKTELCPSPQLHLLRRGRKPRVIEKTPEGEVMGFAWSPDGRQIAYTMRMLPPITQRSDKTDTILMVVDGTGARPELVHVETAPDRQVVTLGSIEWR